MTRDTLKLFASHFSIPLCHMDLYFGGTEKHKKNAFGKEIIRLMEGVKKRVI
jgi:hypothetical protein